MGTRACRRLYDGRMNTLPSTNPTALPADHPFAQVQVLAFDIFGTVVDLSLIHI